MEATPLNSFALPSPRRLLPGEDIHPAADLVSSIGAELMDAIDTLTADLELLSGAADLTPAAGAVAVELQATMHRALELSKLLQLAQAG